jgi:hypothetical protein
MRGLNYETNWKCQNYKELEVRRTMNTMTTKYLLTVTKRRRKNCALLTMKKEVAEEPTRRTSKRLKATMN